MADRQSRTYKRGVGRSSGGRKRVPARYVSRGERPTDLESNETQLSKHGEEAMPGRPSAAKPAHTAAAAPRRRRSLDRELLPNGPSPHGPSSSVNATYAPHLLGM